jgi:hypothetical protein
MVTSVALAYLSTQNGAGSVMTNLTKDQAVQEATTTEEPQLLVPAEQEADKSTEQQN